MTDENIGKDIAAHLSEEVKRKISRANAEAEEKASIFLFTQRMERAASSFSVQVRHEGSLVIERQSERIVTFRFFGEQTLTVDISPNEISLRPAQSNRMSQKLLYPDR